MIHGYASAGELGGKKSFKEFESYDCHLLHKQAIQRGLQALSGDAVSKCGTCQCAIGLWGCGHFRYGQDGSEFIERRRFKIDLKLGTALVDMYAKCENIDNSLTVFNAMNKNDMFAWIPVIVGLANHGLGELALDYFSRMISEQTMPDSIMFICVLSAFSPVGLADKGLNYFNVMNDVYGISPKLEHYR